MTDSIFTTIVINTDKVQFVVLRALFLIFNIVFYIMKVMGLSKTCLLNLLTTFFLSSQLVSQIFF